MDGGVHVIDDEIRPYVLLCHLTPIYRLVASRPPAPTNCLCCALHFGCATFEGVHAASCGLPCTLNLRAAQAAFTRGRYVRAPAKTKLARAKTKLARWRVWRHAAVAVCAPFGVRLARRARALCCAYACVMALAVRFVVAENA